MALIVLILRTPREPVVLSGSSAGQALEQYFNQRSFGLLPQNQLCRGVLLLPESHTDYLRGRRRQALRTNLRRATDAGIQCEVVSDLPRALDDTSSVLRRHWGSLAPAELHAAIDGVRAAVARPETTVAVARDAQGRPQAIAAVVIDDIVCLIRHAVATRHEARWALHDHLVRILIAERVRYLVVEGGGPFGALGFAAGVHHYQHLLGYELRHVVPAKTHRRADRRRLRASVVVVGAGAFVMFPRSVARVASRAARPVKRPRSRFIRE